MVALGAAMDLEMYQMIVVMTFLNSWLEEVIYIDQSKGFVQKDCKHLKWKLKVTYGLKQSKKSMVYG